MDYVASREEMQQVDAYSIRTCKIPGIVLMEKAAMAMEEELVNRFSNDKRILIVTEKGNNGGDGLALARMLLHRGFFVDVYEIGAIPKATDSYMTQKDILVALGYSFISEIKRNDYDVIVDAIFGVGLKREVAGIHREIIEQMNQMSGYKIALDMPSGVDASTGRVLGIGFRADLTITVGLNKVGLLLYPGADYAGEIIVRDIGFPVQAVKEVKPSAISYTREDLSLLPQRKPWSNKGSYGRVLLIAGTRNMAGAAYLSALAAYRSGAGLVRIYTCEENRNILQTRLPDAIMTTYSNDGEAVNQLSEALNWADAIGFGPGLGMNQTGVEMLQKVLREANVPIILDADGINLLSQAKKAWKANKMSGQLYQAFLDYPAGIIVTPHMKEMERLSGYSIQKLIDDRIALTKAEADEKHIFVLKDSRTIVTDGDSETYINVSGNHGMAVGGSGDVLAGILTAFAAVEDDLLKVARLGVYCHGLAGDEAAKSCGHHGMMAGDIAEGLRNILL